MNRPHCWESVAMHLAPSATHYGIIPSLFGRKIVDPSFTLFSCDCSHFFPSLWEENETEPVIHDGPEFKELNKIGTGSVSSTTKVH